MAIDLDNFPTRRAAKEMMEMISPIYDSSYVMKWIMEVMGKPLSKAEDIVDQLVREAFPETCTWTIDYWEDSYNIPHNKNLTLQERRNQLISKLNYRRPMNPARICQLIAVITKTTVELIENVDKNTFEINILQDDADVTAVQNLINKIKQSHLTCNLAVRSDTKICLTIGQTPWKVYFRMCGTYPDTAHGLSLGLPDVELSIGSDAIAMKFIPSGTIRSGVYPKPYAVLDIDGLQLGHTGEGIPLQFEKPGDDMESGTYPQISHSLESEDSGAGISASEDLYATDVNYCGEEDY